jgi:TolB-like protein
MFFKKSRVFCLLSALILAGCGTSITIQVQKTPVMNTGGIKRIAIKPFEANNNAALNKEMAQYITATVTTNLRNGNYFTLIDFSEVDRLEKSGETVADHIDAIFTGQITNMTTKDSTYLEERTDPKTEEKYKVNVYLREVELNFTYRFIRTRDGGITNILTKQGKNSDTKEARQDLVSVTQLLQSIVFKELSQLAKETAPYTANETRSLASEDSKDKELKAQMKAVESDVKKGNYKTALERYLFIYSAYNNYAAAYNAAIMHEAMKDLPSAIALMQSVYAKTGTPKANAALTRLNKALQEQQSLITEYAGSQRDKVTNYAIEEIYKVLPNNAKIWIFNNAKEEKTLSSSMVDGITAGLIKKGVTVVDRENSTLVEAEQKFQASGNVSDKDFVSLGKAAGANTLVTIAVTGTSSNRRLQVRVLDIEKSTNRYQSDTSDFWKL